MAYQDLEASCRFMDESDGDEDEQAQHPGEGRDGDEEYTNWKQHPFGLHASGEGTGQVEEQELEEIVVQGQYDDNLVTTEQGRDGSDSQGRARHPLDGEVDKEGQESDEEPEVTDPLLPEPPGAAAPQVSEADVEGGKREEENSETQSLLPGSLGQSVSGARTQGSPNVRVLDPEEEGNSGCGEQTDGTNQNRGTYAGGDGRGDGEENTDGTNQHRGTDTARDGRGDGDEHTDGTNQPGGKDAGGDGRGNGEEHTDGTNQPGGKDAVGDGRGNGEEHTDGTNQPGGTNAAGKGRVQAGEQPGTAVQGGLVTGWNPSELFEAIKHKLGVLEASVRGGAIDVRARINEFNRNTDLLTDDQRQQIDMILNTDTETHDMIREWDRQCGVNHDLSIDCILGEKFMIKQLAKFRQTNCVEALLDVILAEGGSKKTEKDDKWADLFNQLGGLMLLEVFGNTDLLEKIITSQCCNPSELVKGFVQVMKQASETTTMYCDMDRGFLGSTIDGSIAEIMPLMKTDSSKLLKYLRDILNDLDAIWSKWMAEHEKEHADVEESEQKEEDAKKEKDSQRNQDLSIDYILGEKVMIKQLAKFVLSKSIGALLDVILVEGGSGKKEKDDEWADLFKQLGGLMLLHTFARTDRLKKITSQCCNPSKLVTVFIQVMKKASNASTLLLYLKDILNDLDNICSKWMDEHEEEHADIEESEKKEEVKKTEKDSQRPESLNITSLRGENNEIIIKIVEFNLTKSVKALLDVLLSAKDDNKVEDGKWVDLFKQLGPNMLRNVFDEKSGPRFMKIIESERWRRNASLAETIFDGIIVETHAAFDLLRASIDQDDDTKTVFTELATSCNSLCSHDLFQLYTEAKWKQLRPYCIILFVMYLCMTFSLIYTLVTSVMAVNVHIYESGLDHSRLVFEVIAAISVIGCLLIELYQIKRSRWGYFTDWNNWLELLSSLLLCISIPMRFKAEHVHWYFFAFGYLLWIPQWRKQSVVFKEFYIQAEIFVQVLKHDVPWFSLLFLVINIAFAGASYLTLRGENDLHVDKQTSSFPEIFFMGVRTLAEGQPVLEYYGNEEYRAMSIAVMVIFLFAMCVILLNLLIAQISKTLDKKSKTMDNYYHIRLAFTLAWMDILLPECCKKLGKTEERWKNYMAQPQSYKEKIISKTEKMDQHLAKITGDLQDVSQKFSIRVKKTAKQDRADTKARNGIATENDVQKTRRQQTEYETAVLREMWNTTLKDKDIKQQEVLDFIEMCIKQGHKPAEWMVDDSCPLYVAVVEYHRLHVLRRLLELLDRKSTEANERKAKALYTALRINDRFYQAALLVNNLKTSEPQRVLDCFHHGANLYHDDYYNNPLFQDFWLLFLDDMMNQKDMSLFDKNVEGEKAEGTEPTIFHRLAYGGNTDVFKHAALKLYIEKTWNECGRKKQFICDMLVYLITLACLTVVVVLSGQADDVNSYQTETDRARLVFEIISAALLLYTLVKEAIELVSTCRIEFNKVAVTQEKEHKESRWWLIKKLNSFADIVADLKMMRLFALVWRGIRAYWKDHFNKAECTSTLLLLPVTIIARVSGINAFWYIFAFGYFLWVMIVFKYASIHRELSTYAQSLWIIITTDVVYFLVLFSVVNLAFSGFFVLILKGENSMHVHNETSTFWGILFFGVRALTDGQNSLNYYDADGGPDGYNTFLTVATMIAFLFVVIVILANILIAQLSRSYNIVQDDAEAAALVRKARDIARLERFDWPYCYGPLKSKDMKEDVDFGRVASCNDTKETIKKLEEIETNVVRLKDEATRYMKDNSETGTDLRNKLNELWTTMDLCVEKLETDTSEMNNVDELKKEISIKRKAILEKINELK